MAACCGASVVCAQTHAYTDAHARPNAQGDFVLVSGDVVTNVNLAPILEAHRARREADKQAIYTMVRDARWPYAC
jgi:translation initiation factor eIF-2B subunit epsilon